MSAADAPNVTCDLYGLYEIIVRLQRLNPNASKCNFEGHLDVALRDRLLAGINGPELQRKLLSEKDTSFQNLRVVCEINEDLKNSTQEPPVLLHQSCSMPHQAQHRQHPSKRALKPKVCGSCGGHHPRQECKYRQAACFKCQKKGHIKKVCRIQTMMLASTEERECNDSLTLMASSSVPD